jgi:hypothetical protein
MIPVSGEGDDVGEQLKCSYDSACQPRNNPYSGTWNLWSHSCYRPEHWQDHLFLRDVTSPGEREADLSTTLIADYPNFE